MKLRKSRYSLQGRFKALDEHFLKERLAESREIVREVAGKSDKPLIVQFSGGNDSMALVGLVREVTDNFLCCFMVTGYEFPEAIDFAARMAREIKVPILFSQPNAHKGNLWERLEKLGRWPTVESTWCSRDLKVRAQKKTLEKMLGKGIFYKLNGVRRYESSRRKVIYGTEQFVSKDNDCSGKHYRVHPLLRWTNADVKNYLEAAGLPSSGLYKRYGVSGCYWCPFYQVDIYKDILRQEPNLYDEFIAWEEKLGAPSVIGEVYLRDLKREVLADAEMEASKPGVAGAV